MSKVYAGDVVVQDIKVGDIHYEYAYGTYIKAEVISLPKAEVREDDTYYSWESKNVLDGNVIDYGVSDKYSHYGPKLYNYEAYTGCRQI